MLERKSARAMGHDAVGMIQWDRRRGRNTHIPRIGLVVRMWERGSPRVLEEDLAAQRTVMP